jgi:NAD+ synthase (glutamine-hydrolysing)
MKIALAQINPLVGDIRGNLHRVIDIASAAAAGVDLVAFPEMCIAGYPAKDLLESRPFIEQSSAALAELVRVSASLGGVGILAGLPLPSDVAAGKGVANAAVLVADGRLVHKQEKSLLPTYDVFDEARYFDRARRVEPVSFRGERLGISICEDAWNDPVLFGRRSYDIDPIDILAKKGTTVMINVSASPFAAGKDRLRYELVRNHARRHGVPFIFLNQVGGNDELVFDGASLFVDGGGALRAALPAFEEAVAVVDTAAPAAPVDFRPMDEDEGILAALVLGTRDYLHKCGFTRAIVGLSGGIDSAVTLCIAVRAIGAENVHAVAMPSPYSSRDSITDAMKLAANLGVDLDVIEIADVMKAYDGVLAATFKACAPDVTEENIQARIRGNILMAYSNKFDYLVLSTGNKSELAVGYCTLYGDMSGGLAVISDVPKLTVYALAERINRDGELIPRAIIEKPPSAELKPGQLDQDTLPPYEVLDAILDLYVEERMSGPEIVARGYDPGTVEWVVNAVRKNEYKRKQAAPGLKVTSKAFGVGRRFPIAARHDV